MNNILTLPLRPVPMPCETAIHPGYRYRMQPPEIPEKDFAEALQSGVLGAYRPGIGSAVIEAVDLSAREPQCFVWDADLLAPAMRARLQTGAAHPRSARRNRLTVFDASLDAPEVRLLNNQPVLTIAPRFELEWSTDAFASQLGLVQLVESSRTLHFEDGDTMVLLDTEAAGLGPVLYLSDSSGALAVKPVCAFQPQGEKRIIDFSTEAAQIVPAQFNGKPVASVGVLEKYSLYFMQNPAPDQPETHIWTPVHLPVVWGWSIRVQQRFDGVWDIFRKKLIVPMPSTEAPALPRWQGNSLQCRRFF